MRVIATLAFLGTFLANLCGADPGTAFTYQGVLNDGSGPVDGQVSVMFTLHDAPTTGTQIGPTVTTVDQLIVGGMIQEDLDFGPFAFDGDLRWLEIAIDSDGGVDSFVPLLPRVKIRPTPYAIQSKVANSALNDAVDDADADPANELQDLREVILRGSSAEELTITLNGLELAYDLLLDQSQDTYNAGSPITSSDVWQSFTVGETGILREVAFVSESANPRGIAFVLEGEGDTGSTLAVASFSSGNLTHDPISGFYRFPIPSSSVLTAGSEYTLWLRTFSFPEIDFGISTTNVYAGGVSSVDSGLDLAFQTYMDAGGILTFADGSQQVTAYSEAIDPDSDPNNEMQGLSSVLAISGDAETNTIRNAGSIHIVGEEVLDQIHSVRSAALAGNVWQSFTTDVSGRFARFSFWRYSTATSSTLQLSVYRGTGTGGELLGTKTEILPPGVNNWHDVLIGGLILMQSGQQYTVLLERVDTELEVGTSLTDSYPDGGASNGRDIAFRTYIVPGGGYLEFPDGTHQFTAYDESAINTNDADADPTNELQGLASVLGNSVDGGGNDIQNIGEIQFGGGGGQYSPVASSTGNPMRTVAGAVTSSGAPAGGTGFTASANTATYTIEFDPAFLPGSTPIVTATPTDSGVSCHIVSAANNQVVIQVEDAATGVPSAGGFNFIAVGAR